MTGPLHESSDGGSSRGWVRWAPVLVILLAWMAHLSARQGTWVLDDVHLVRDNALVARGPVAVPHIFAGRGTEDLSDRYGALTIASFAIEAPLWKQADGILSPAGFHLTNLLLHGLCALLLFRLLLGLLPRRPVVVIAAALLFAVHPLHAGTVAALMGRSQLLATLLALLTALAWRAWGGRRLAWVPVAALAWLLALQASPLAIGVPLVLLLLDVACPPRGEEPRLPGWRAYILAFLVPLAVFLGTWGGVLSPGLDLPLQSGIERLGIGCGGLARTILALLVPVGLRSDHSDEAIPGLGYTVGTAELVAAALVVLVTLWALVRAWRGRAGVLSAAWLGTAALFLPAALLQPAGAALETPFAYLTALPLFVAAGILAQALFAHARDRDSAGFAFARGALVGALALIALAGLTHREALGWRNDAAFHERLLDRNPQHVRAMVRIARSQRRTAEDLRAAASTLPSESPERAAFLRLRQEALADSAAWGRRAVRHELGRRSPEAWRELGFTLVALDKTASALRSLERARELDPLLKQPIAQVIASSSAPRRKLAAEMYFAIGHCRAALGSRETAADAFVSALRLDEGNLEYLRMAGTSLCRVMRYGEGLRLLLEARRRTQEPLAREELDGTIEGARRSAREISARLIAEGEAKQSEGEMREAVTLYERALEVNPVSPRALIRAGWLRGMWFGSYEIAETYFRDAEALLRKGKVRETDPDWRQLKDFRQELAKQKAAEEREEGR